MLKIWKNENLENLEILEKWKIENLENLENLEKWKMLKIWKNKYFAKNAKFEKKF